MYIVVIITGGGVQDLPARFPGSALRHQDIQVGGRRSPLMGAAASRR